MWQVEFTYNNQFCKYNSYECHHSSHRAIQHVEVLLYKQDILQIEESYTLYQGFFALGNFGKNDAMKVY